MSTASYYSQKTKSTRKYNVYALNETLGGKIVGLGGWGGGSSKVAAGLGLLMAGKSRSQMGEARLRNLCAPQRQMSRASHHPDC